MSVRLMHLADLHLGAPLQYLGEKAAERAGDLESAFARALDTASEKQVHAVLISGDLFDRFNPPSDLVERSVRAFERIARRNIPVILIPGTHDSRRYSRCIYLRERFPGVDVLLENAKPVRKQLNGHTVFFYGFSGEAPDASASSFSRTGEEGLHIALVHGAVAGSDLWAAGPRDFSLSRQDIERSGFHYVALGHYHNFKEFGYGATPAVYPGTLEGLKFGENGDRYLVVAEVGESAAAIEKTRFNRRTIAEQRIDLALSGIDCNDSLIAAIKSFSSPNAISKVLLTGSCDFLPAQKDLEERLAGDFFHLQIEDETSMYDSRLVRSMQGDRTVQGIFVRKMLEKIDKAPPEDKASMELGLRLTIEQFRQVHYETQQNLY